MNVHIIQSTELLKFKISSECTHSSNHRAFLVQNTSNVHKFKPKNFSNLMFRTPTNLQSSNHRTSSQQDQCTLGHKAQTRELFEFHVQNTHLVELKPQSFKQDQSTLGHKAQIIELFKFKMLRRYVTQTKKILKFKTLAPFSKVQKLNA